jgi:hypothetical protein
VTLQEDWIRFTSHSAVHIITVINTHLIGLLAESEHHYLPSAGCTYAVYPNQAFHLLVRLWVSHGIFMSSIEFKK